MEAEIEDTARKIANQRLKEAFEARKRTEKTDL